MNDRRGQVWDGGDFGVLLIVGPPQAWHYCDWSPHRVDKRAIHHPALDLLSGRSVTFIESDDDLFEAGDYTRVV